MLHNDDDDDDFVVSVAFMDNDNPDCDLTFFLFVNVILTSPPGGGLTKGDLGVLGVNTLDIVFPLTGVAGTEACSDLTDDFISSRFP